MSAATSVAPSRASRNALARPMAVFPAKRPGKVSVLEDITDAFRRFPRPSRGHLARAINPMVSPFSQALPAILTISAHSRCDIEAPRSAMTPLAPDMMSRPAAPASGQATPEAPGTHRAQ